MLNTTEENIKIIFGLKLKRLRTDKHLSLQELSNKSGVSVSYLNEIENGKKYPKTDKIADMAKALDTTYDQLVSLKINKNLTPVVQVLNLKIINDFLFETFGVDKSLIMGMMASTPIKISALINSVFEIARTYNLKEEHFYFSCLRSYQELNDNYFEEIEVEVDTFRELNFPIEKVRKEDDYANALQQLYSYRLEETDFIEFPKLRSFRSVYVPGISPTLLFNKKLTEQQRIFLLGRELGFSYLKLDKRPLTTSWLNVASFDHVLNNFKASYFAQALHINKHDLERDLEYIFSLEKFDGNLFIGLMDKYIASPEMLFQRMCNILPKFFGINELFFIRYSSKDAGKNLKDITKELHLSRNMVDLEYILSEQNYRRWITKCLVKYIDDTRSTENDLNKTYVDAVVSNNENGDQYLSISILRPMPELNNNCNSVTIGIVLTDGIKKKIRFINDPDLAETKLADLADMKLEAPYELKKQKEIEEREREYERLVKELRAHS